MTSDRKPVRYDPVKALFTETLNFKVISYRAVQFRFIEFGGLVSEAPDDSRGTPHIILICAKVARVHVVGLYSPGEIPEWEFVIETAAQISRDRLIRDSIYGDSFDTRKPLYERPELTEMSSQSRAGENAVFADARPIVSAPIHHQANERIAGKRNEFERGVPSPKTLAGDHVDRTGIRSAHVSVPMRDQLG